jgi:type II secretory pathway component PulK
MTNTTMRRGVALIIVLTMTALLALLALTFSTLASTDQRIARNYLDTVRARLVAESGVDAALGLLQNRALRGLLWTDTSWSVADGRTIRSRRASSLRRGRRSDAFRSACGTRTRAPGPDRENRLALLP